MVFSGLEKKSINVGIKFFLKFSSVSFVVFTWVAIMHWLGELWGCWQGGEFRANMRTSRPLRCHTNTGAAGSPNRMAGPACAIANLKSSVSKTIFLVRRWNGEVGRPFLAVEDLPLGVRKEGKAAEEEREFFMERILAPSAPSEALQSVWVGSVWHFNWLAGGSRTEDDGEGQFSHPESPLCLSVT